MAGKILTPQDEAVAQATEFSLLVNVNGEQLPLALAKLLVQNEQANALTRIAGVLEAYRDQESWYASQGAADNALGAPDGS